MRVIFCNGGQFCPDKKLHVKVIKDSGIEHRFTFGPISEKRAMALVSLMLNEIKRAGRKHRTGKGEKAQ